MIFRLSSTISLLFFYLAAFCQSVSVVSEDEVCLNEVISLQANTSGSVSSYSWKLGDNTTSTQKNPTHSYKIVGPKTITLEVYFADNSILTDTMLITVLDKPLVDFKFVEPICVGQEVIFESLSDTVYDKHRWRIRDGHAVSDGDYHFTFEQPGVYNIKYTPTYEPMGSYSKACFDTAAYTVDVREVKAGFSVRSEGICNEYVFTDSSLNATSYLWDFGQPSSGIENSSTDKDTRHSYKQSEGKFTVSLIVEDDFGCSDTALFDIESEYIRELTLYNVFTPNGDGVNDGFRMDVVNQSYFKMDIYNRYGELVFRTNDPNESWNGKVNNQGKDLPASTYFYIVDYQFNCENVRHKEEGIVDLIRP